MFCPCALVHVTHNILTLKSMLPLWSLSKILKIWSTNTWDHSQWFIVAIMIIIIIRSWSSPWFPSQHYHHWTTFRGIASGQDEWVDLQNSRLSCQCKNIIVSFSVCNLFCFHLSCQVLLVKIASDKCDKCKASNSPKLPSGHSALKPLITIDVARNRKTFLFLFLAIYLQLR